MTDSRSHLYYSELLIDFIQRFLSGLACKLRCRIRFGFSVSFCTFRLVQRKCRNCVDSTETHVALLNYYYYLFFFTLNCYFFWRHLEVSTFVAPAPTSRRPMIRTHNDQITELSPCLCCALDLSERAAVVSACLSRGGWGWGLVVVG